MSPIEQTGLYQTSCGPPPVSAIWHAMLPDGDRKTVRWTVVDGAVDAGRDVDIGVTAAGEVATGEVATGEVATGEVATGEVATGEVAAGEPVARAVKAVAVCGRVLRDVGDLVLTDVGDPAGDDIACTAVGLAEVEAPTD